MKTKTDTGLGIPDTGKRGTRKRPVVDLTPPIHCFFGLSYANYLVLPRTLLQSCSIRTQRALCRALEMVYEEEAANMPHHWPHQADIEVQLRETGTGRFVKDDLADYQRGRRRLWKGEA